jgi:hypothetical protein
MLAISQGPIFGSKHLHPNRHITFKTRAKSVCRSAGHMTIS